MRVSKGLMALSLVALIHGGTAVAAGGGNIFVGGGLASSDLDDDFSNGSSLFLIDDSDLAYNVQVGVDINEWLQAHAGWQDLGGFDSSILLPGGPISLDAEVDGFFIGATFHHNIGSGKLFVYGTLGIMVWDLEIDGPGGLSADDDGSEPYYGLGLGGKINDQFTWMGGYTRYEIDQVDVDTIGVNLIWYPPFANH